MSELSRKRFGNYLLTELIGEGGMAVVYRAEQITMENREVAVKVLGAKGPRSEELRKRFQREAKVVAQLQHPHIVPVIDFGKAEEGQYLYLVMQLMRGGNLAQKIEQEGPFSLRQAADMLSQIASALTYAHNKEVVHRDLKPANVLLDEEGNAYLTDFGIAKIVSGTDPGLTQPGIFLGTPAYMAPELWGGENIGKHTDIYALGIIAYEMVVGVPPFSAETPTEFMRKHMSESPPPPERYHPQLPPEVGEIIFKALAKAPQMRYQEATEFASAFKEVVESAENPDFHPPRPERILDGDASVAVTSDSTPIISSAEFKTQISEKSRTVPKRPQGAKSLQALRFRISFLLARLGAKKLRRIGIGIAGALLMIGLGWWLKDIFTPSTPGDTVKDNATHTATPFPPTAFPSPTTAHTAQVIVILPSDTPTNTTTPAPSPMASPTQTSSATLTPSKTVTHTNTPTLTPTLTLTLTLTDTSLPTSTPSPTRIPITQAPTATAFLTQPRPPSTSTANFTLTGTRAAVEVTENPCLARVNVDLAVNVRAGPSHTFAVVGRLLPGELAPVLLRSANGYAYTYDGWVLESALQFSSSSACQSVPTLSPGETLPGALCSLRIVEETGSLRIAPQTDAVRAYLETRDTTLAAFRVVYTEEGAQWYYVGTYGESLHMGWISATEVEPLSKCPASVPWDMLPPIPSQTPVPTATVAPHSSPCYVETKEQARVALRHGPGNGFDISGELLPGQSVRAYFRTTNGFVYVEGGWGEQRDLSYTSANCAQLPVISPQNLSDAALCRVVITANTGELRTTPDFAAERMYVEQSGLALSVLRIERGPDGEIWYYVATNNGRFRFGWIAQEQVKAITSCP